MLKTAHENEVRLRKHGKIVRSGLNVENLTTFPISEIPPPTRATTPYRQLLSKIGKGDAVCLTDKQVSLGTASNALRKLLAEPEFKDYKVTRRTIEDEVRLYIIHE